MRALAGSAPEMRLTDFDAIAEGLVALAAKSIAPALARAGDRVVPPPLASFVTVRRYIDRKLASPDLSANSIAAEFGLSRASLYRLFEPAGGIAKYIRKVRLSRAYQGLPRPNSPMGGWIYRLSARIQECERLQPVVPRG